MTGQHSSCTRVLVVDDSAFMRAALSQMIRSEPGFEVVGTACSGWDALEKIGSLHPDVLTLDLNMPGLGGLETLHRIMDESPLPVIVISAAVERGNEEALNALSLGAFDYVPKQLSPDTLDIVHIRPDLISKLNAATQAHIRSTAPAARELSRFPLHLSAEHRRMVPSVVAIGASTGGPRALEQALSQFPCDLPVPILVVQHMPAGFTSTFAKRLNSICSVNVREASHGDLINPGFVYIAPAGLHMTVERQTKAKTCLRLSMEPSDSAHRPSIDVMMTSVANTFREHAIGIILTGMGSDGALGMNAIYQQGGFTVGQDEASCVVYGMPRVCAELGILRRTLPISRIPNFIIETTSYRKHA